MPAQSDVEKRYIFIVKLFFAVTNNPNDDVNPFLDYDEFLTATVSDLTFGTAVLAREMSKQSFAKLFRKVLQMYDVGLSYQEIMDELSKEDSNLDEIAKVWAKNAKFPI